jgi:sugar-specific transcriptional regulator TrmB
VLSYNFVVTLGVTSLNIEHQEQLTQALCKLGLSLYQAKVYSALAALGPSGVAEIQRVSGVPRTKIYEVLEQLLDIGAVEFQSGRPVFYNALSPSVLVDRMRNSYLSAADDATRLLAEIQQTEKSTAEDVVWTVRGMIAIHRKAALTIASAKERVIMVEQYPLKLMLTASPILKSMIQKKVKVRAVCVVRDGQHIDDKLRGEDFIEFRKVTNLSNILGPSDDVTVAFRKMIVAILSKKASLTIVDDQEAFLFLPDLNDDSKSVGLTLKIPGLPMMQRILFEQIVEQGTVRLK